MVQAPSAEQRALREQSLIWLPQVSLPVGDGFGSSTAETSTPLSVSPSRARSNRMARLAALQSRKRALSFLQPTDQPSSAKVLRAYWEQDAPPCIVRWAQEKPL